MEASFLDSIFESPNQLGITCLCTSVKETVHVLTD